MAPFLETEIMTIKKIEVGLKKMDFKLLKDASYKLHEKFHSGYKFEYIDILKEIKEDVLKNPEIPHDIKGILVPTIEDIENSSSEPIAQNKVSSLTSLSFNSQKESQTTQTIEKPQQQAPKIDAFSAFSPSKDENKTYSQSPIKVEPFREFSTFEAPSIQNQTKEEENTSKQQSLEMTFEQQNLESEEMFDKVTDQPKVEIKQMQEIQQQIKAQEQPIYHQTQELSLTQEQNSTPLSAKTIAIYYHTNNSTEKVKNITKYRYLLDKGDANLSELLSLMNEINTQSNINVSELKTILEQLIQKNNKINLVTNSTSSDLINLLNSSKIDFNIFDNKNEKQVNLLPFLGLTNLFVCRQCQCEYLHENNSINPIILQCPNCKAPMFPNIYTIKKESSEINTDYYNASLVALSNSKIWLLIHPNLEDKTEINLLRTALKINNQTQSIFIADKDINVRETYKKMFLEIKQDLNINTQINVLEDFFKLIK